MRYLNRIIFINSANVPYAEIALDGNVHFIGTQGVGKSTLLRAILFFYNGDKLKLGIEKGKRTFDEYYFPYGNSYIIYEVTRENGTYCILALKSQGRVCFRFINSGYQQQHYIEDNKVKTWEAIRDSFGKKANYTKKIDSYREYLDILYGNNFGLEKEFRKYALLESRQYQNIPRTIQNVFLNSKLDAEFIKQTIIMSLNEDDVKIELDKYALHLRDFDTELADINKWTEKNKSGEIPVRKMAENIARIHTAILALNREKQETALQMFHAHELAAAELPVLEKQHELQKLERRAVQEKADELWSKFQLRREEIQKRINILENDLKNARTKAEDYERMNITAIIQRVEKKDEHEAARQRLQKEGELLNARFSEINSRYEALVSQISNNIAGLENERQARRNKAERELLLLRAELNEQLQAAVNEIRAQHETGLEVARNGILQRKDNIHSLKLRRQKAQLQRYFEEEITLVHKEIAGLNETVKVKTIEIADHKKQVETLQKQVDLDLERSNAVYDRKVEKWRDESVAGVAQLEALEQRLLSNKDSLYAWLGANLPGWEKTIGKVIDEERVLFHPGLAPQLAGDANSFFGVAIDLEEISKPVKTLADYEAEKIQLLKTVEAARTQANALVEERNLEADKIRARYQSRIRDLNNARKQLEYDLQKAKGLLPVNEVRLADFTRKAAEEKERMLQDLNQEIGAAEEDLINEEKKLVLLESSLRKAIEQKEKEHNRKVKAEGLRIKEVLESADAEFDSRRREAEDRIEDIRQQQKNQLASEGADVDRLESIDRDLDAIRRELEFIDDNRDRVAEYRKDKRELLDHVDNFKTEKRLKEGQLASEQEKYSLQKQKLEQEIAALTALVDDIARRIAATKDGILAFNNFRQTVHYQEIAGLEGRQEGVAESPAGLRALVEALSGKIYALIDRYNDLQGAINKFLGNFSSQNIFGFRTNLADKEHFVEFAEMLYEFLEENKIVQFEKRVNERFARLIMQIGKETTELTSKGGEIQKVITEINRDFEERNFAGVIKSIRLQLSDSRNNIVALLQEIKQFNDKHSLSLGVMNLFSAGDNESQNKKAVALLKDFAREINARKEKEIGLPDSFDLQFRIVENENDSGWVEKLTNVGSEGTDILVKAMINIMLLNVFKVSASKRFKDFRLHCMMDEIGKLHPNNVKGILKFANDRNILLINSSPTSYNATDYRYTYLLTKDNKNSTTVKRLIKKGAEL